MCKKNRKEKEGKEKKRVERSYQARCWVHRSYYLLRMVLWEVEGASVTPSKLKIQATNQMLSKLAGAYQTLEHETQMTVSKST